MLWAEGTVAGILLFWHGQRLLARFGPDGLMMIGGAAGIIRWILSGRLTWLPSIVVLQPLHAFTFGASYLGAMHFLSRATPFSAAAGAQSIYVAVSSGLGGGLVMVLAGALYADYGGMAYLFMAVLSAAGLKRFQTAKDGAAKRARSTTAVSLWRFFNYRFIGRSSGEPCPSVRSPCAFWMSVVDDVGDGVIVERPRVESASQFQHLGRLLADLRRWDNGLFASRLIGQAGLPGIEYALRVLGPGAAEMVDHRVLIADDRVLVTRPEFTVNGVSAS
jgi:hypothetical protein